MKRLLLALALAGVTVSAFAADVGVSISVGQPGFYGQIDIGNFPQPRLIYREPILVERVTVVQAPLYLYVPPGEAKNWRKHCHKYGACGRRVYFVEDRWYNDVYVPHYRELHRDRDHDDDQGQDHDNGKHNKHGKHKD
jgi:hypothetical protein